MILLCIFPSPGVEVLVSRWCDFGDTAKPFLVLRACLQECRLSCAFPVLGLLLECALF